MGIELLTRLQNQEIIIILFISILMTTTETLPLIFSFYTHKGGVGKTTSVHNITHILAQEFGLKVMLVDMDPQASLTGVVMHKIFEERGRRVCNANGRDSRSAPTEKEIVDAGEEDFYEKRAPGERTTIYEIFKGAKDDENEAKKSDESLRMSGQIIIGGLPKKQSESQPEKKKKKHKYNLDYVVHNLEKVVQEVKPITIAIGKEEGKGGRGQEQERVEFKFIPGDLNITVIESEITEAFAISEASEKLGSLFKNMPGTVCRALREIGKKEGVEVILLDLNPGAGGFNMACIMGSDYFIVPSLPDFYSRRSIKSLSKLLKKWNTNCDFFREQPDDPFKFPSCPVFLGQIYNQVKIFNMEPTFDQREKIAKLQSEIETRLKKYMTEDAVFLKDAPIIPEFTRLIDKVEEVGVPISRARHQDILSELIKRNNITHDEVTWEAKLHLNCYFAAVVHIFSNLSPLHHKLLKNVLKLDINSIFPPPNEFFSEAEQPFKDDSDETWERLPRSSYYPLLESNRFDVARVLNQINLDLSNDIYNAFSLLRQDEKQFAEKIKSSHLIHERLKKFKEIQIQLEKYKKEIPEKVIGLQDTTRVFKLEWENMPKDPQLCKLSFCSREKEEKATKHLSHSRARKVDSYFDSYIETRFFINKMARFLTNPETKKAYFEIIQFNAEFIGELSLCVYAGSKNSPLKIWTKDHEDGVVKPAQRQGKKTPKFPKIKVAYATLNSEDKDCVSLLCETKSYSKTYTEVKKKVPIKVETKGRSKNSSTQSNVRKPQETINRNGKRGQPPQEEGMETKKKNKN